MPRWLVPTALLPVLLTQCLLGQSLEIRFLDVGQGDAVVIRSEGKVALVDAGRSSAVVAQLRAMEIDTIDLLVASHNHADHIGGILGVLGAFVVRYYVDNGVPHTTATYQRTIEGLEATAAVYLQPTARRITLGSATLRLLPPPSALGGQNNSSVGVLVQFGQFHALFTGDSEQSELEYWLKRDSIPAVQVLKVAHHGSWNGSTEAWAQRTRPQAAVISVGARNQYGHPSSAVIDLWTGIGAKVYRTDELGTITVLALEDGSFTVTTGIAGHPRDSVSPRHVSPRDSSRDTAVARQPARACCRICRRGKACGNSCISRSYQCHRPPGCACDAAP